MADVGASKGRSPVQAWLGGAHAPTGVGPGGLPEGWREAALGEVADINMGQSPPSSAYNTSGHGLPFLQGKAEFGAIYPTPVKWCSAPAKTAAAGSVLVSVRAPVGDVNLAREMCCIGRGLAALNGYSELDNEFLFYQLVFSKPRLESQGTGSTFQSISRSVLHGLSVALPPVAEQRAIAHVLSTVQRAIEATEAVIAAARDLKRSLMRHLFTYGPVPVHEAERVRLKESPFAGIPERWSVVRLDQLAYVQTGAAKGRRLVGEDAVRVPYLRVANVQDGYLDLSEIKDICIRRTELQRYSLQQGDVLLTEGGDFDKLGRGFIWNGQVPGCVHQNHIFAVRTDRGRLLPSYLAYLAQSGYGKAYFLSVAHRTTHLACTNSTKLRAFPVPLPPLEEQQQIASLLSAVDRKIEAEESRCAALAELFRSLLHQLMTGRVRVTPHRPPNVGGWAQLRPSP